MSALRVKLLVGAVTLIGAIAFLAFAMGMATASVDRLEQIPARVALLFDYSPSVTLSDSKVSQPAP